MRTTTHKCALFLLLALVCGMLSASEIELPDVNGKLHKPLDADGKKAIVLIFVLQDCPIANAFAPEIKRICKEFEPKGAAIFLVQVDPKITAGDAKKHAQDFGYDCPVLLDPAHELVRFADAKITPEAFVYSPERKLQYRGRINNLYADLGKKRFEATQHDLREALDAVLNGKVVPKAVTEAVGCFIPPLTGEKK